ncbi:ABC transporter substrate-binding protein [Guggenheimella bovis]
MKKWYIVFLIALLVLSSCQAPQNAVETKDSVVIAVPQDPDFLDPHKAAAAGTKEMIFNIFEGLLKPTPEGTLVDCLAQSHEVSADGLTYSATLRDGVTFHNGKPVTADDVLYSYNRLKETKETLKDVEIKANGNTIEFVLKTPNAAFLEELSLAILCKDLSDEEQNKSPVGTGPYKFVSYEPTQSLKLTRNDSYWNKEKLPKIKDAEFRIFSDANTAFTSLKSGEVDLYPRITPEQLKMIGEDLQSIESPQNLIQFLGYNLKDPILSKPEVRAALNACLDRDQIIKRVADGQGTAIQSNMSPVMKFWYKEGLKNPNEKNIEEAKKLLEKAGLKDGFELTITTPSNYEFHVKTAEVVVEQLKAIGVNAKVEQVEWSVWLDRVFTKREFQSTIIAFDGKLDPNSFLAYYQSEYARNFFNYKNDKLDTLLKEGLLEQDQNKRQAIYQEAQAILVEDPPAYYIMDPNYIVAMSKSLKGYTTYPIYVQDLSVLYFE